MLDKSKDGDQEESKDGTAKEKKASRVSLSFFDRLATPKFSKKDPVDQSPREALPKKDTSILRVSCETFTIFLIVPRLLNFS